MEKCFLKAAITIITTLEVKFFPVLWLRVKVEGAENLNVKIFREICLPM